MIVKAPNTIFREDLTLYVCHIEKHTIFMEYLFDKTYEGINFKISDQYINDVCINTLIIDNEFIDEIDIEEIVENGRYFESMVPNYIKELIDMTDIIKDVNESMRKLYETWQW